MARRIPREPKKRQTSKFDEEYEQILGQRNAVGRKVIQEGNEENLGEI